MERDISNWLSMDPPTTQYLRSGIWGNFLMRSFLLSPRKNFLSLQRGGVCSFPVPQAKPDATGCCPSGPLPAPPAEPDGASPHPWGLRHRASPGIGGNPNRTLQGVRSLRFGRSIVQWKREPVPTARFGLPEASPRKQGPKPPVRISPKLRSYVSGRSLV
jgi:hypothetical protein